MRSKCFDRIMHDPGAIHPIRISTIHTLKGAGTWGLSLTSAKRLAANLAKAIARAEADTTPIRERAGKAGGK